MASLAGPAPYVARDDGFFVKTAIAMAIVVVAGFSLQLGMGRSSFARPAFVHAHAIVFMGWVVLYVTQIAFAATGSMRLHRRLGWIGAGWIVAMLVLGTIVTVAMVRAGRAPFFFRPQQFLIFDPLTLAAFVGLTAAAIVNRRRTDWHRRLHYCGMSILLGAPIGRLIPLPLLIPYAFEATTVVLLIFPAIGVIHDLRRRGSVHPAWKWGIGAILGTTLLVDLVTYSPVGDAIYHVATAGSPGADVAPLGFPPWPPTP